MVGDSLPFGRPRYGIQRHSTWPYIVKSELFSDLCMRAKGGSTSFEVLDEARSVAEYWFGLLPERRFDATFVQVGIVDLSPRLVSKRFYRFVAGIPLFSRLQRNRKLHELYGKPWVPLGQFAQNIRAIDEQLSRISEHVFYIEIARPEHFFKENLGDFSESVLLYNKIISGCVGVGRFVSCWDGKPAPDCLLPDGHHLTEAGHRVVAQGCLSRFCEHVSFP